MTSMERIKNRIARNLTIEVKYSYDVHIKTGGINLEDDLKSKRAFSDFTTSTQPEREENEMRTIFDYVKEILEYNKLGPIAFITPELGRWSTMGGLGVMV